jgi:hypothetical protein
MLCPVFSQTFTDVSDALPAFIITVMSNFLDEEFLVLVDITTVNLTKFLTHNQ